MAIGKVEMMRRVGAQLTNVRWGWDGVKADGSIVFIGWKDHVVQTPSGEIEGCQIFRYNAAHSAGLGGRERARHIDYLMKNAAVGYLVLATPKDPRVRPREIVGFDPIELSVRLERRGDEVFAIPVAENSAPEIAIGDPGADIAEVLASQIPETEKAQLVQARRGQGLFRARVEMIEPRCRVTGIGDRAHLRAGHIKPWRDCTDEERLDGHNGLLLAPHIDHLFDRGFISFEDDGRMLVSPRLRPEVLRAWNLDPSRSIGSFTSRQEGYLNYHRARCFISK